MNIHHAWRTCIGTMVSHRSPLCKTVEGVLQGEFASLSKNDTIVWVNEDFGFKRTVRTKVTFVQVHHLRKYCKPRGWTRLCLHMG
jgi:hypothetical protein